MRPVPATREIAALTLDEAVASVVANDDLTIPDGHRPVAYLTGVATIALVADIYAVPTARVARLALRKIARRSA